MPITYDPKAVALQFGGALIDGFAPDTFIEIEYTSERYATAVGSDGKGIRSKRNDRSATIRITLIAGALSNTLFQLQMAADEAANAGAVPFSVIDPGTGASHVAAAAWVNKDPEKTYASETEGQVWELMTDELIPVIGAALP